MPGQPAPAANAIIQIESKIHRAQEFVNELQASIEGFYEAFETPIRVERSQDGLRDELFFAIEEPPPTRLGVLVGDVLHNLRSAVEHMVFAIALRHGELAPRDVKRVSFPICETPAAFAKFRKPLKKALPAEIWEILEASQPYQGKNPKSPWPVLVTNNPETEPLTVLRDWSNIDKHRMLLVTHPSLEGSWIGDLEGTFHPEYGGALLEPGALVGTVVYPVEPIQDSSSLPVSFVPRLRLDEGGARFGIPGDLWDIESVVRKGLLPQLAPYL